MLVLLLQEDPVDLRDPRAFQKFADSIALQNEPGGQQTRGLQTTQDGIDTLQNERLAGLARQTSRNTDDIHALTIAMTELTIQIRTYTSVIWVIGLVFGGFISVMQVLQFFQNRRMGRAAVDAGRQAHEDSYD